MEKYATLLANNSQQCWDLLRPFAHSLRLCKLEFDSHLGAYVVPTMLEDLCKRIQHCYTSFGFSQDNRNVGWLKSYTGFKNFTQQLPTTRNNMPKGVQTEATCNIQKCWELFANNVAFNYKGLCIKRFSLSIYIFFYQSLLSLCWDLFETFHFQFREMVLGLALGLGIIKTERH